MPPKLQPRYAFEAQTALNYPACRVWLHWTPNFRFGCGCCGNSKTEEP